MCYLNTYEGALRHITMLPTDSKERWHLLRSLERLNDPDHSTEDISHRCADLSTAAISEIKRMLDEGKNPLFVRRRSIEVE